MSRDYVTVVAGLPRSGTSMMMQMLQAGGIPVLSDGVRTADEDNPRGYLELERVKTTKEDSSWVAGAVGRAVKMAHILLLDLPLEYQYRVIFMRRPMAEVVESQNIMLRRRGHDADTLPQRKLEVIYLTQIEEVLRHAQQHPSSFRWLQVSYPDVLADPATEAARVADFLDGADVSAMTAVVQPDLYRVRSGRPQIQRDAEG